VERIREDPARLLRLGAAKFARTWSLTPNVAAYSGGAPALVSAVWMLLILAAAGVGIGSNRHAFRAWVALLAPVPAFALLHTIYVGSVRYRVPVMPLLMVASAVGLAGVMTRRRTAAPDGTESPVGASA
jgi:hypothetical protein